MAAWLPKCPASARAECAELLAAVLAPDLETACRLTGYNPDIIRALEWPPACEWTADGDALLARVTWTGGGPASDRSWTLQPRVTMRADLDLVTVHAQWRTGPARPHPAAPLLRAWQRRPTPADPFVPAKRASLPRLTRLGADDARLPDFPEHDAPAADGQLLFDLPGIGEAVRGCASWLLWLFDKAGGESLSSGRGAPWDLRLFVYALLHLDVDDRDGEWHTILRPTDEVIGWLHPHGWRNERRDWHKLPKALHRMRRELSYVPVPGIGSVAMLLPSVIPERRGDPLIEFTVRVPPVAAHGDRLNWPRLLAYGADSARLFRAYLAVVAWLGRSARSGHPITRMLPAPVLGPDGKPARHKGGRIVRSATERIDNPAARYAGPPLSEADLTRMIGFDPAHRKLRQYARAAFDRMEADGVIEIARSAGGFLIYGGPNW